MYRKTSLLTLCALTIFLLGGDEPDNSPRPADFKRKALEEAKETAASYTHVVLFHLKKDAPKGDEESLIADCQQMLTKIPTVRKLRAGRPAQQATERTNKDYQVGLMVLFDNFEGLQKYLDHDQHKQFVKKHEKSFEKVQVFDFENQLK